MMDLSLALTHITIASSTLQVPTRKRLERQFSHTHKQTINMSRRQGNANLSRRLGDNGGGLLSASSYSKSRSSPILYVALIAVVINTTRFLLSVLLEKLMHASLE